MTEYVSQAMREASKEMIALYAPGADPHFEDLVAIMNFSYMEKTASLTACIHVN